MGCLFLGSVHGDASVRAHYAATAASVARIGISLYGIVVAVTVYLHGHLYKVLRACYGTKVASLATLCVYLYDSLEFCHSVWVILSFLSVRSYCIGMAFVPLLIRD